VYWPIRQVSAYFHSAADGLAAFQEIFSVLQAPATQESEGISHVSEISWDALEVAFPGRALIRIPPGKIAPGELTALVGPSGSGKSTLAAVLLGFVKPTQGEVWLAQEGKKVPLSTLDIRHWRAQVSWQPQEPKFPLGTIAEILRHAQPNASDGELVTALAKVDLNITDLPDGLHTELGTLRQKSSVGQLRKIALARALLKKSSLIILDEPTASVDDISEATIAGVIQQSVKEGSMVLLISHREPLISAGASIIEIGGVL
jgi:ABC-type transport system involved in cytochrome bd biosynthesis fused ATPase/permease subunit